MSNSDLQFMTARELAAATTDRAQTPTSALELAYGLLWLCPSDRHTLNGERIYQARQALLGLLNVDSRKRGVQAAMLTRAMVPDKTPD